MFLFIDVVGLRAHAEIKFKYILCSYLSISDSVTPIIKFYLNTSYVLIYPTAVAVAGTVKSNLNTSYVLIYRIQLHRQ